MPTKPSTPPRIWDSLGVYGTGPFIGNISRVDPGAGIAAEGHRPGANFPTAAEHENDQQFKITTWVTSWLALGSSAGAADAHILETAATGRFSAVGATFVDAVDEVVLSITGANTALPAVRVTSAATAFAAVTGNNAGTGFSAPIGTGAGVGFKSVMTGSDVLASGLDVTANGATAGAGVTVQHAGAGSGIAVAHSGAGAAARLIATGIGYALDVVGSAAASYGARIIGGSGASLYVEGVASAFAGLFYSSATAGASAISANTLNTSGKAIIANTMAGALSTARAIIATATGAAHAIEAVAAGGYAILATGDTTSPTFPAVFITGQNTRAASTANGGLMFLSSEAQFAAACAGDGTWRGVWTSESGYAYGGDVASGSTFNNGATWVTALTFDSLGGNAPKTLLGGSTIRVRVNVSARTWAVDSTATLGLRILDTTAVGTPVVWTRSGTGGGDGSGWRIIGYTGVSAYGPPVSTIAEIAIPLAGDRTWRLEFSQVGAGITIRDVSVEFLGIVA